MKGLITIAVLLSFLLKSPIRINNIILDLPEGFEITKNNNNDVIKEKNTTYFRAVGLEENDMIEFKIMPRVANITIETAKSQIIENYKPETDYGIESFKTPFFKGHTASFHNIEGTTFTQVAVLRNDLNTYHIVFRKMYTSKQQGEKIFKKFLNSVQKAPVKTVRHNER
ncbi:MAG: hypothetical protein NZ455_00030 [Bacteroidia bacterium]|nr:hypothetical protein [Bacteroidia bacterium]MDW8346628.1 hypothetical protein [Bacteroidia bacterium]